MLTNKLLTVLHMANKFVILASESCFSHFAIIVACDGIITGLFSWISVIKRYRTKDKQGFKYFQTRYSLTAYFYYI